MATRRSDMQKSAQTKYREEQLARTGSTMVDPYSDSAPAAPERQGPGAGPSPGVDSKRPFPRYDGPLRNLSSGELSNQRVHLQRGLTQRDIDRQNKLNLEAGRLTVHNRHMSQAERDAASKTGKAKINPNEGKYTDPYSPAAYLYDKSITQVPLYGPAETLAERTARLPDYRAPGILRATPGPASAPPRTPVMGRGTSVDADSHVANVQQYTRDLAAYEAGQAGFHANKQAESQQRAADKEANRIESQRYDDPNSPTGGRGWDSGRGWNANMSEGALRMTLAQLRGTPGGGGDDIGDLVWDPNLDGNPMAEEIRAGQRQFNINHGIDVNDERWNGTWAAPMPSRPEGWNGTSSYSPSLPGLRAGADKAPNGLAGYDRDNPQQPHTPYPGSHAAQRRTSGGGGEAPQQDRGPMHQIPAGANIRTSPAKTSPAKTSPAKTSPAQTSSGGSRRTRRRTPTTPTMGPTVLGGLG